LKHDRFQIEKSTHIASGAIDTNISQSIQQVKLSSVIPVKNDLSTDQIVENNPKNKFRGKWSHFGTNSSEEILTMTDQFKSTNLVLGFLYQLIYISLLTNLHDRNCRQYKLEEFRNILWQFPSELSGRGSDRVHE
jgi:hypothetical protein